MFPLKKHHYWRKSSGPHVRSHCLSSALTERRTRGPDEAPSSQLRPSFHQFCTAFRILQYPKFWGDQWFTLFLQPADRSHSGHSSVVTWAVVQSQYYFNLSLPFQYKLLSKGAINYSGWSHSFHQCSLRWKTRQTSANMTMVFGGFAFFLVAKEWWNSDLKTMW